MYYIYKNNVYIYMLYTYILYTLYNIYNIYCMLSLALPANIYISLKSK